MASRLIILSLVILVVAGCAVNPITGREELMLFPEEQDIAIGRKYAPEIEKQLGGKIDDPILQDYINTVGQSIVRVSHNRRFEFHFTALNHESVNAFALPGGYIFVTRGMLEKLQSEAQLAAVLAHETVHVVARDVSNMMSKQIGIALLLTAVPSEKTPQGVLTAADLARQIISLKFSRDDERDADLGGLDYMVAAGYDPYGMVETMHMLEKLNENRPIEFLSSHPSPKNRVKYISKRIQVKYYDFTDLKVGTEEYHTNVLERLNLPTGQKFDIRITKNSKGNRVGSVNEPSQSSVTRHNAA